MQTYEVQSGIVSFPSFLFVCFGFVFVFRCVASDHEIRRHNIQVVDSNKKRRRIL